MTSSPALDRVRASIDGYLPDMVALRHDLHRHPELGFAERRTSDLVAGYLQKWGYSLHRGLGGTGLVATLTRGHGGATLGLRADMDALPIEEGNALEYASQNPGSMHACGHDGHTITLLTAARYLAEQGNFQGTLRLIFQPAEESLGGGLKMLEEGLFEQFPCDAVFGLHNMPGVPAGKLCFIEGPAMASSDQVDIRLQGRGGHGGFPHLAVDPVVAAASLVMALQTVVARNLPPLSAAVVSVGSIQGGATYNVIPDAVDLKLTVRSFSEADRDLLQRRITELCRIQAESFGAQARIDYRRGYPVLINDPQQTRFARQVAIEEFGERQIGEMAPIGAAEDFAYMLQRLPGCYLFLGNGDSAPVHHPQYNFNDAILPIGAAYWVRLVERFLA